MARKEPERPTPNKSIKPRKRCFTPQPDNLQLSVYVDRAKTSISKRKASDPVESKLCTLQRAQEIQFSLDPEMPSFLKHMLRSHVSSCFWLGLPLEFCKLHLPKEDTTMILVNKNDEEYPTKFLADKNGLSGGWRGFSIVHKLLEGDVLVFHLIKATKFKVHIIKEYGLAEIGGTRSNAKQTRPVQGSAANENPTLKRQKSSPLSTILQQKNQSSSDCGVQKGHEETESEKVHVGHAKTSISKRKSLLDDPDNYQLSALQQTEEDQSNLDPEYPSFVKKMLPSHVSGGFWLGLPSKFCELHLPKEDTMMTLVNENGEEYQTKFLAGKIGLSAGWRGFSIVHKLLEGDILLFHLINATKFKVSITRKHGSVDDGGCAKQTNPVKTDKPVKKSQKSPPVSTLVVKNPSTMDLGLPTGQTTNNNEEPDIEALLCSSFSRSIVKFEDVKNLESFSIMVDGFNINSEFSEYTRTKYYELCCNAKAFLHEHLLEGMNFKLVAGIITETVNIADAIEVTKLSTSQVDLAVWDKSLLAFEHMGMNVTFLRSQLKRLMSLDIKSEQAHVQEEIRNTKVKLLELETALKCLEADNKVLKVKEEMIEIV